MVEFTFEGDIESLSVRQQEFLCEVLEKKGYKGNKVHIEPLGKAGDNYSAYIKQITVYKNDGDRYKMIAKIAPTQENTRIVNGTTEFFNNETIIYSQVLPKFTELQRAAGIPETEKLKYVQCYGILREVNHELLLLEDLELSNFKMLHKFQSLANETVKLILRSLAILHSLSFVLKKEEPETFASFNERLVDYFCDKDRSELNTYLQISEKDCLEMLDSEESKKIVRNSVSQMGKLLKASKYKANPDYSVIIHGDAWTNNIMFKLKNNVPVEAMLIDYQLSKVSNPAVELLGMIFNCTDHSTRLQHYYEWIDFYHSELTQCLSNYGMNTNFVYPRSQLDADLKMHSKCLFACSLFSFSVLIKSPEDATKFKKAVEARFSEDSIVSIRASNLESESATLLKSRIKGLIDSYREFGYIN